MDAAVVAFVIVVYANLAALAGHRLSQPVVAGALSLGLIALPFLMQVFVRRRSIVADTVWLGMLAFFAALLLSTFGARDPRIAFAWIVTFLTEGLLLYVLVLNAIRSARTLRRVVWALILAAAVLGSMSAYQELAHDYGRQFGGLAQRNLERDPGATANPSQGGVLRSRERVNVANRAAGPIGDPNRYAQMLLFVLPLAFFRMWDERRSWLRWFAAGCMLLILVGVVLTYSRGGILTLALLVFLLLVLGHLRWRHVLIVGILSVVLAVIVAPGLLGRLSSMGSVPALLSDRKTVQTDGAVRGRLTEMLAALNVFLDHPVVGVGPGQFTPYYSMDYMSDPEVAFRRINRPRRAHNLYLEVAAETGILGLVSFLAVAGLALVQLWRVRRRWQFEAPEYAHLATAFWLSVVAYLGTGFFLQLAYQRYYWLLLGLAGASVRALALPPAAPAVPRAVVQSTDVRVVTREASFPS